MENPTENFFTKGRTYKIIWFIVGHGILYLLKIILTPYINTTNIMIDFLINNFGLIISSWVVLSGITLLTYWKIRDIICNYINWLNSAIYDHALRINLINAIISSNPSITGAYLHELKNRFSPSELIYLGFTTDEIKGLKPIPKELNEKINKVIMDYNKNNFH